jgi:glycosyltransferase involved in cell wall biosynthesis
MNKITAVIITFNEAANIEKCLISLAEVVDEIVIVDAFSVDDTVRICNKYDTRIYQQKWISYSWNKNFGNRNAKFDYILSVDADEVLSEELRSSILAAKDRLSGAYCFNRLANYCGKWIYHCGWYPDIKTRLFNRNEAQWEGDYVHEHLNINVGIEQKHLSGDLLHNSFNSLNDHVERVEKYSYLAAKQIYANKNLIMAFLKMIFGPVLKFLKCYLLQRGFLDGFYGFCISIISSFDVFLRYAKVIQLKHEAGPSNSIDSE